MRHELDVTRPIFWEYEGKTVTMDIETNLLDSEISTRTSEAGRRIPAWFKVSAVAAASAMAGGLAAAWYYRKSLSRLRNAELEPRNTDFGISDRDAAEED